MADDTRLREMYAAATQAPRADHPSDETWERLAMDELPPLERDRVSDHVTSCAPCAEIYRGLRTLEDEARAFDPGVPKAPGAAARPATAWYAGLAAAAVLLLALLLPFRMMSNPPADTVRSPESATPVALAPVGDLAAPPHGFRWTPLAGIAHHRVELSSADGERLWTSADLEGGQVPWPEGLRLGGGTYYWRVVTVPDPDRRLSSPVASPTVSFRIAP
jgi:hypothetical protein